MNTDLSRSGASGSLLHSLRRASEDDRRDFLVDFLRQQITERAGLEPGTLRARDNLMELGINSLKAIEFKGFLESQLDTVLRSSVVFDHPNIDSLADFLLRETRLAGRTLPHAEPPVAKPIAPVSSADLEGLNEEQLAQKLAEELRELGVFDD